jgi:hypothetical protein
MDIIDTITNKIKSFISNRSEKYCYTDMERCGIAIFNCCEGYPESSSCKKCPYYVSVKEIRE